MFTVNVKVIMDGHILALTPKKKPLTCHVVKEIYVQYEHKVGNLEPTMECLRQ